jgi:hypothetical protein
MSATMVVEHAGGSRQELRRKRKSRPGSSSTLRGWGICSVTHGKDGMNGTPESGSNLLLPSRGRDDLATRVSLFFLGCR